MIVSFAFAVASGLGLFGPAVPPVAPQPTKPTVVRILPIAPPKDVRPWMPPSKEK